MKTFSIAELEQYTLIKAHTFRTWEQRFDIFKSKRTSTNLRYYTLEDLSFLLNISFLNRYGYKVSELACLSKQSITEKVLSLDNDSAIREYQINQLLINMFSYEIEDFELILDCAVLTWGIEQTIEEIILPFIERLDLTSYKGRTSPEYHFVVAALRKKLIHAIEHSKPDASIKKSALLFLPEGEHYDLLLLYINYKLKFSGLNVLYLGTNISFGNLQNTIERKQPNFAITYVASNDKIRIKKLIACLKETKTTIPYFVTSEKDYIKSTSSLGNIKFVEYRKITEEMFELL